MDMYNAKNELIRDLCSVEFRTKSKTKNLINKYTEGIIKEVKNTPMGVSQWKSHGIQHWYWDYFKTQVINEYLLEAKNSVKINKYEKRN